VIGSDTVILAAVRAVRCKKKKNIDSAFAKSGVLCVCVSVCVCVWCGVCVCARMYVCI
jgi:hypothetical protein